MCACVGVWGGMSMCLKSFVNVKPYHDDRITLCGVRVHVPSLDWLCARVSVCVSVCVCLWVDLFRAETA